MAKILISYWRADEKDENVTLVFWDGLFKELCRFGNDVLAINNAFYNIFDSNKTDNRDISDYIHSEFKRFKPDVIIAFNNRILQSIVDEFDGPVILYDGDELKFFSDKGRLKRDLDRYTVFSITEAWRKDYLDFGFKNDQIHYMPPGTAIRSDDDVEQIMNVSFLGQRRFFLNNEIYKDIENGKNCNVLYKTYLDHLKSQSYEYKQLYMRNGGINTDITYKDSDLWPLFDDSYLLFANILDLGLHLGGHSGGWRDIAEFIPQIAVTHSKNRVFTLEENEDFYNASKISLNPNHPQGRGKGFSWRCWDIMASNACLVSSASSELRELTRGSVDIPMFNNPYEAREICTDLLNNPNKRREIVIKSQEFIEENCRWINRFRDMEDILGIKLINEPGKIGTFKKLSRFVDNDCIEEDSVFSPRNEKITEVPHKRSLKKHIRDMLVVYHKILKRAIIPYERYSKLMLSWKSICIYVLIMLLMVIQYAISYHNKLSSDFNSTNLIYRFMMAYLYLGEVGFILAGIYKPIKKVLFAIDYRIAKRLKLR